MQNFLLESKVPRYAKIDAYLLQYLRSPNRVRSRDEHHSRSYSLSHEKRIVSILGFCRFDGLTIAQNDLPLRLLNAKNSFKLDCKYNIKESVRSQLKNGMLYIN